MTESSATAAPVVELQLRGMPHLRLDGASLLLQPKAAGLLAYLASNGETARRTIAALLWPGVDEGSAATNLRQCLRRLRKQAGCELTVGKQTLRLVEHVRHDAVSASQLADDARGELLHGHDYADCPDFDAWLGAAREREDRDRTEAMVAECERLEAAGDIDAALARARRLLAARPLEEHSHRRVIRLHYLRGDKSAAMAAFHHCESILRTQLGAEPGAETLALRETLIAAATPGLPTKVRSIPAAVLRPPVVVGRAPMLAALRDAWRERRAFIVAGDAGMGKSRLLEEFAAVDSRSEALVVVGRARPGDDHVPYASMVRVLAAVQAELGGHAPAVEAHGVVLAATRQLATAAPRTLRGVIVDDLQFADAASLELMTSLACAGKAEGPCWGFALRAAESSPGLLSMCDQLLESQGVAPIHLTPLDNDEMAELLDSLALDGVPLEGIAASLVQHTGGNPMYALETIKLALLTDGLASGRLPRPASVGALIARRLQRLSESALKLARVAAIAGSDFDVALAEHVLDMRALALADAWHELEAAQILRGSQFAHDLVYEATLASIPAAIAAHVHASVAEWLQARPHEPARVARHWLAAGRDAAALGSLHAAAHAARASVRRKEEVALLREAARIEEGLGDTQAAFATLRELAETSVHLELDAYDRSVTARLLALAESDMMRAQALCTAASVDAHFGDYPKARQEGREAVRLAERIGDQALAAECNQALGVAASLSGDNDEAMRAMLAAETWVMANGSASERMEFQVDLGVTLDNANRHGEAQRRHRLAIEGARELRRYDAMSIAHANLAISLSRSGKVEAAIEHALTSERLRAMSREATPRASTTPVLLMRLMRDAGRYGEAMRWAELARTEIETHFPLLMSMSLAEESWLWIQLGQHRRAEACLLEARKFPAPHPWMNAAVHHRRGQIERSLGRDPRPHFEAAEASFGDPGLRIGRSAIALDLAATLPPAEGLVAARRILEESVALEKGGLALAARVRTVQCLLDAGDPRQAAATAREMLAAADGVPTDEVYRVEMWWQAQRAFDAAGFSEEARAARHTAVQWIDRVVQDELPPAMRRAFIEANPINRLLLHAARI